MPLINPTRIFNNLITLAILAWIFFMIYSKMDREKVKSLVGNIKGMFGKKEE